MRAMMLVFLLAGSATIARAQAAQPREAAAPASAIWLVLQRSDSLIWFVDSASIAIRLRSLSAWFAVVDTTPAMIARVAAPFRRFETLQELDCQSTRVRSLRIRTPDRSGRTFVSSVRDSTWQAFAQSAVPLQVLRATCRRWLPLVRGEGAAAGAA